MPSRVSARAGIEHLLRATSIGVLAWMLWLSLDRDVTAPDVSAGSGTIVDALKSSTTSSIVPSRISVRLDSTPHPYERDWLAALRGAGSDVRWSGTIAASGISAQPLVSPNGGLAVMVAAPDSAEVALSDDLGAIDTVRARGPGSRFVIPAANGALKAQVGGTTSNTSLTDSVTVRRVLVTGSASWESKFVIAALEEDGWKVDADVSVAPGVNVSQGATAAIDTARYAAVVLLDDARVDRASRIAAYVRSGGGLILAGRTSAASAFGELRAAALAETRQGSDPSDAGGAATATPVGVTTLRTLALAPLVNLRPDAVVLDNRGSLVAAAARRHAAGRVLQHGYADTWRWRLSGGDNSVAEHRRWWSAAVASVAYAPRTRLTSIAGTDPVPLASLTAKLGPQSTFQASNAKGRRAAISPWWLFALLSAALLAEWASRRLRGVK